MQTDFSLLVINLGLALVLMLLAWVISVLKKDAGVTDIFWGLGFIFIAWVSFFQGHGYGVRSLLLALMTSLWGLRLAIHILLRNWGQPEDRRYQAFRRKYGNQFWYKSLYIVFGFQALLMWVISLVMQIGISSPSPERWTWLDTAGTMVWALGFVFEATADLQLSRFKADPAQKGKVMNRG